MASILEIKASGVALLEGSDAARVEEQHKNIAPCPLPILDSNVDAIFVGDSAT